MDQELNLGKNWGRMFDGKGHAKLYSLYRPEYPEEIYDLIKSYCSESEGITFDLAIDAGCGNGQSTFGLCKHFKKVIGIDVSARQIKQAISNKSQGLEFVCGPAEDLSFIKDGTVDLVTAAMALHWMDIDMFYKEVVRVLKPGGALIVYGYSIEKWGLENDEAKQLLLEEKVVHLDERISHTLNQFEDYPLPFEHRKRVDDMVLRHEFKIDELIGFLSSFAVWQKYQKANPESTVLEILHEKLKHLFICQESGNVKNIVIEWPMYTLMGRKSF